ncbi:hypothetical protein ABE41_018120 [Fictibacillus arsenicus]|uniref:Solute-binding protein family 3/N-terminal domain-containing protein n=1 Tax=Fictibacillus arsenicus TaxID=255247 RepID=A0A1B1Z914_9BACL|nr:hypothetical protein ABE41_018120 [Fictibacillus arsenicus]
MKKQVILAIILVLVLVLSACSQNITGGSSKNETMTVKIGLLNSLGNSSIYLGDEKGIFKKHGIKLDFKGFQSAQPISVAAQTGDIDVGSTAFTAGFFNLLTEGNSPLRIVADGSKEWPGYNGSALMVSKNAFDNGVKEIKDLKGKKIGVTQNGSSLHYMAGRLLEKEGLNIEDVTITPMGGVGNIAAALESNQIDAGVLLSTAVAPLVEKDKAKLITWVGDETKIQLSSMFYSKNMLEDEEKAKRFLAAYIESVRYYHDNVLTAKDKNSSEYKDAIKILAERTKIPEEKIPNNLPYIDRNAELWKEDLRTWSKWYNENDLLEKEVDVDKVVATDLYDDALKVLDKK